MDTGLFIYFPRDPGHNIYFMVFDGQDIYFLEMLEKLKNNPTSVYNV